MVEKLLETLGSMLKEEGMDCAILDTHNEIPCLQVYLGEDHQGRERILEISADEQLVPASYKGIADMQVERGIYRIELRTHIPIDFQPEQASNMASAINFINGLLELPGFISNEVSNDVYYRTVQISSSQEFNKTVLIGLVGMHRMALDTFSGILEKIGTGEMTFLELLDEIVRHTKVA